MTQMMEMRKVVAAYSIQTIIESSGLNEQDLSSWLKRHIEKSENWHSFWAGSFDELSMDFQLEESFSPSATNAEQSSIMMSMMLILSQTIRMQKTHLLSSILRLTYRLRSLGLFFMRRREAYISMRKKMKASSERVQTQQEGSASKKQIMKAMAKRMLSKITRGPILSMLVNIVRVQLKCKINPFSSPFSCGFYYEEALCYRRKNNQRFYHYVLYTTRIPYYGMSSWTFLHLIERNYRANFIISLYFVKNIYK